MELIIMVNLNKVKCMDMGNFIGLMEKSIKDNIRMVKSTVMVKLHLKMDIIEGSFWMVNIMVKESLKREIIYKRVYFRMVIYYEYKNLTD